MINKIFTMRRHHLSIFFCLYLVELKVRIGLLVMGVRVKDMEKKLRDFGEEMEVWKWSLRRGGSLLNLVKVD